MLSRFHSADLRKGRVSEPGRIYLVTTVCHERARLFADFALARLAVNELRACDQTGVCRTLAYVLMPDHLHWLIELRDGSLSVLIKRFKSLSGAAINRQRGTSGTKVWQAGFHDHGVRGEEDLAAIARYIVANPLRAGLVKSVGQYPHWDAVWL